jgi:hypothetical protein
MRRRIAASHPLVLAALAGAALGLLTAVLLIRFGDAPGAGTERSNGIFIVASLPTRSWMNLVFGWGWWENRAAELMTMLTLNGAVWVVALTVLGRGMRRSAPFRWIALGGALAGTAVAILIRIVGFPVYGPYDGARGLIVLAQAPGIMLLSMNGYDTIRYDGTFAEDLYRPGPVTLLLFSLANALLAAGYLVVARFTWRWIRAPMPRRSPVAER